MPAIGTDFRPAVKRFFVRDSRSNSGMGTIGSRVQKMREAAGLSRPQLAAAVGMKKTTLQTLEEKPQRTTRHLLDLAAYFKVNPDWLRTGRGQREAIVKAGSAEYEWSSHFGRFDRQSLSLSLQWSRWQEEQGLESQPERRVERFMAMYRRFLADGGTETPDHLAEIANAVQRGASNVQQATGRPD